MDCNYIKGRLRAYLDGNISDEDNDKVSEHLAECSSCMKELEALEKKGNAAKEAAWAKSRYSNSFRAAEKKLKRKVSTRVAITLGIITSVYLLLSWLLPAVGNIYYLNMPRVSRAFADVVQFSQPLNVGGYGNSYDPGIRLYTTLESYTHDRVGKKGIYSNEIKTKLYMFSRGIVNPIGGFSHFIHPGNEPGSSLELKEEVERIKKVLEKNKDTTVSTLSLSLNSIVGIEDIRSILKGYDLDILWMAVESGRESIKAKNMSNSFNQYYQWGIPGSLFSPKSFNTPTVLQASSIDEYFKAAMDEMIWLRDNQGIVKADKGLLSSNGIDTRVGNRAQYVIDNGFKIYGLKVTGPSEELLRLCQELDIRHAELNNMDFWNWK